MSDGSEGAKCEKSQKSCCAPSAAHAEGRPLSECHVANGEISAKFRAQMVELAGGTFLMGTDYDQGFPDDGEGPIHSVTLRPFAIDRYPVTNERFREFVQATGYRTEAEIFGWSFVFWAHIPASRRAQLVQDTVAAGPWWCKVGGAKWDSPEGPGSDLSSRDDHPVFMFRGTMPRRTRRGPAKGFRPKLSGSMPRAAGWCKSCIRGVTNSAIPHRTVSMENPAGPLSGTARVMKGGSLLCHKSYCNRYRVAARTSNTPDGSTSHIGFRCVL